MNIFLNIFLITVITCYLIDITGIVDSIKVLIKKLLNINPSTTISIKPFDCSLCMSHHINVFYLFYILIYRDVTFTWALLCYAFILFCSCNAIVITSALNLISEAINTFLNKLYNKL